MAALQKWLVRQTLAHPALLKTAGHALGQVEQMSRLLSANSGLRLRIPTIPDLSPGKGYILDQREPDAPPQALYFTGCLANHLSPAIARAARRLVKRLHGQELYAPPGQGCCGMAALSAGDLVQARELARRNIRACDTRRWRGLPIFTSCASCYAQLKDYPRLLANDKKWAGRARDFAGRVREFAAYLLPYLNQGEGQSKIGDLKKVVYHDPCHLRFGVGHDPAETDPGPARQLINKSRCLELTELPHGPQCCGQGGAFHISHPMLAKKIGQRLWHDFARTNSPLVTTTCTGCLLQWRQGLKTAGIKAEAVHLAVLLDKSL
jgi:glycolate oxidase iron-sulfur subunit